MTTTTTTDVFAQAGYAVTTKLVDRVDNQGEPCEVCQIEGRYIDATVYGVDKLDQVGQVLECCVWCVPATIQRNDALYSVTVELGDSLAGDDYDDRMSGPDDTRPHPDAL